MQILNCNKSLYPQITRHFGLIFMVLFSVITLAQQPIANFTYDKNIGCGYLVAQLTDKSSNNPVSWSWKIYQDNNTDTLKSTLQNPVFAFYSVGNYHVLLTVKNASGSNSILKKSLFKVYKLPSSVFNSNKTTTCANSNISLKFIQAASEASITSWNWDFGDGHSDTVQNPNHTYANSGSYRISLLMKDANGCENEYRNVIVNVSPLPKAEFLSPVTISNTVPATINFTNKSKGTNLKYQWYVNNTKISTLSNSSYSFKTMGSYDVALKVIDPTGCTDSIFKKEYIKITTFSDSINSSIQSGCAPLTVNFSDMANSGATTWKWYFGDGDSSSIQNPIHIYKNPGLYTVILKTTNAIGAKHTKTNLNYIQVFSNPVAEFIASDTTNCTAPFNVNFKNTSSVFKSCEWNFGDGTREISVNPKHIYKTAANFSVSLTIIDNNNCSNTILKKDYIKIKKTTIQISKSVNGGCKPLSVAFTNNTIPNATIIQNKWYFGDGSYSIQNNPTHLYTDTGNFNVSLVITDAKGCKDSTTFNKYIGVGTPPNIDFMTTDTLGCIPYKVTFKNYTKFADKFTWDYGDGSTETKFAPIHIYNSYPDESGYVDVKLTASQHECENSLTKIKYIHILPPIPGFKTLTPASCDTPFTAIFVNTSKYATNFIWNFNDGSPIDTSKKDTVKHTFIKRGIYNVQLTISNNTSQCKSTLSQTVIISKIIPGFKQDLNSICQYNTINFSDTSTTNTSIKKWTWNFGDGTKSDGTLKTISHKYDKPGNFNVSVMITDQLGCTKIIQKNSVKVNPLPSPNFSADKTDGCAPLPVVFSDYSKAVYPATIKKWSWNLGDGTTDITRNPQHIYKAYGKFTVSLKVIDSLGCDSTLTKTYYIKPTKPIAGFSLNKNYNLSDTLTCFPDSAFFKNTSTGEGLSYYWNFNDGSKSNLTHPIHSFPVDSTKTYNVQLTVTDKNNCISKYSKLITIAHPIARFNGNPRYADCPYPIKFFKFFDASSKDVVKWSWNFGNPDSKSNNFSNVNNPQHSYRTAGYYDVSLGVRDQYGCYDSIMKSKYIFIDGPSGTYDFNDKNGCPPLNVSFKAISSNVENYQWIFGDGSSIKTKTDSISHIYQGEGKVFHPSLVMETKTANGNICQVPVFVSGINGQVNDSISIFSLPKTDAGLDKDICIGNKVTITATGGLSYKWNNSKNSDIITENPVTTTTYIVTATGKKCSKADTVVVNVNQLPNALINKDTSVCKGMSISLSATGGTNYKWSEGNIETSELTVSPEIQTVYTVTATDAKGCSAKNSVTVSIRDSLHPVISGKNEICIGEHTTLAIKNCGTKYKWNTGETTSIINTPALTNEQTYKVTVVDDLGCSGNTDIQISVNPYPTVEAGKNDTICKNESVTLVGAGNGSLLWNNNKTTATITENPLVTTTYYLTVTNKGCSAKDSVTVFVNALPNANAGKDTSVCKGVHTILLATGGVKYKWNTNTSFTDKLELTPLTKQIYIVMVTDKNGCSAQDSVTISIKDSLHPVISGKKELCYGDSTTLTVYGRGTQYIWNTGEIKSSIKTHILKANKTYIVTMTDILGCSGITSIVVKVNPLPLAEAGEEKINCKGNFTDLMASGGIHYSWNTGEQTNFITVSPATDKKFTVTVTDVKGCSNFDSVFVYAKNNPVIQKMKDTTICAGTKIHLKAVSNEELFKWSKGDITSIIEVAPFNSTQYTVTVMNKWGCQSTERTTVHTIALPNVPDVPQELVCFQETRTPVNVLLSVDHPDVNCTYKWYNEASNGDVIKTGKTLTVPGVTSSKTFYIEAISQFGCVSPRGTANIMAANRPKAQFAFESILPVTELADTRFYNYSESRNENESMDYTWVFGNNEGTSNEKFPIYEFKDTGKYDVTLVVTNTDRCSDTVSKSVKVLSMMTPWIPDAFTPNNDSHNDLLFVRGPVKQFSFDVYNQFGYIVYHSTDQTQGWDGKYKGTDQQEGNYTWTLQATTNNGRPINIQGSVVLLR